MILYINVSEQHRPPQEPVPVGAPGGGGLGAGEAPGGHPLPRHLPAAPRPPPVDRYGYYLFMYRIYLSIYLPLLYRSNWSFGQSFLFTVTVVTTIGALHCTEGKWDSLLKNFIQTSICQLILPFTKYPRCDGRYILVSTSILIGLFLPRPVSSCFIIFLRKHLTNINNNKYLHTLQSFKRRFPKITWSFTLTEGLLLWLKVPV